MRFFSTVVASVIGSLIALTIIFIFFFMFIIGLAVSSGDQAPRIKRGSVLVYELKGIVPENVSGDPLMQAFADEAAYDLRDLLAALDYAANDERIEALWIKVADSSMPWATANEVRSAILQFKESGKPVVASSTNFSMAEGEYFIASAADQVYSSPEALFEFNGFYLAAEFYKGLLDKLDVDPQIVKAGKYKGAVEVYSQESLSAENREQLSVLLSTFETHFNSAIASSRSLSEDEVRTLSQRSALMTAREALDAGLIDGLLFHSDVVDAIATMIGGDGDESTDATDFDEVKLSTYVMSVPKRNSGDVEGDVAIVYAEGTIMSGSSDGGGNPFASGGSIGSDTFRRAMQRASDNEDVKAIVVRVNSPGGVAPAAEEMRHEIEKAGMNKPVIVSMGGVAASGGYWIATAADSIIADPLTITGSIGVYSLFFDVGDLFEDKLGITYDIVETNPYADMYSGLRPFTPAERQLAQRSVDDTYQSFLEKVAANRGMTTDEVNEIAQGRVWSGVDALNVGLVDSLGSLQDALNIAAASAGMSEGAFRVVEYPKPLTFFEQFESALSAQVEALTTRNVSRFELATRERIRMFEDLLNDYGKAQARLPFNFTIE